MIKFEPTELLLVLPGSGSESDLYDLCCLLVL
jgi:hypothetical protein